MVSLLALVYPRRLRWRLPRHAPAEVAQHLARAVMAGRACHAAPRMGPRAAQVKPFDGRAVIRMPEQRPCRPQLVERQRAMEDVAAHEAEIPLEVGRGKRAMPNDAGLEPRRVR